MKVTGEMNIGEALELDEKKIGKTLGWLAPDLARLQSPDPDPKVINCVLIEQAARIQHLPLSEVLYVLNLAAGENEEQLSEELRSDA
jgi:hypothetical protein